MASYRKSTAKTPAGVLRAAAKIIRKHGWHQGNYVNELTGQVCLFGAINAAVTGDPNNESPYANRATNAGRLFEDRLKGLGLGEDGIDFNDAPGRKVEDVLAILEA